MVRATITCQDMSVTGPIKDHIHSKIQKINNHFDNVVKIDFFLKKDGSGQVAEANTHIFGKMINVSVLNQDLYKAITEVVDKLDRRIRRLRSKKLH